MSAKPFTIYRSSAGSGKTRTLAKEYLKLALRFRSDYYKHILAVTFTNKATQEMKDRILHYLDDFANGKNDNLATELMQELGLTEPEFKERASEIRTNILHNYSQFSISTIDAFFQKVIRAFTHEAGLSGDYRLEVENEEVMAEVVDKLIDELGTNTQLTEWVIEFARENLENDRAWDIRSSVIKFSNEIFREEFRAIETDLIKITSKPGYFREVQQQLLKETRVFINTIRKQAGEAVAYIDQQGWTAQDFKYGGGVYTFFLKMAEIRSVDGAIEKEVGVRIRNEFQEAANWPNGKSEYRKAIQQAAESSLLEKLNNLLGHRDKHFKRALSAEFVLNNFYAFGLTADLARKLREHKEENNLMLLADAPKFLNGIIRESDTPFIYEKVGSFYRNYLIDEFQDTSGMQWENFKPLLLNSLDQGYPGMVVGDVKQSIYRWRGGDLKLLQEQVEDHVGEQRTDVKELSSNFRSARTVVEFNNAFFKSAAAILEQETNDSLAPDSYHDVAQQQSKKGEGFVRIQFVENNKKDDVKWKEEALALVPKQLEEFQDKGVQLGDIAILVRNNKEGAEVADYLLKYKQEHSGTSYRYDVISNESLRVDGAVSVNIITSALRLLVNTDDLVARAQLSYDFGRLNNPDEDRHTLFSVREYDTFKKQVPAAFMKNIKLLQKLPLFEVTETLVEIFQLGADTGELPYLQTFQNLVLDFYNRERNDIAAFLLWWDEFKEKKSIQVSGNVQAIQILTIHKSKGLQFPYVLIPFCSWEVDHGTKAPLLWVKTNELPIEGENIVPVRYNKLLPETIFAEAYKEENVRVRLDNLNLLYVAFTRAEKGMIITAPFQEVKEKISRVNQLLAQSIKYSTDLLSDWNSHALVWQRGMIEEEEGQKSEGTQPLSLGTYFVSSWRQRMVLRKKTDNIFNDPADETARKRGVVLHSILSSVYHAGQVKSTIEKAVADGLIMSHDSVEIEKQIEALLANPQVASWFTSDWEVKTEVPILTPEHSDVRVDRLMLKPDRALVVDYKSGGARARDEEQVATYMSILREMNFANVEGYILYLATGEVVAVGSKQKGRPKQKNENQLGLGL